MRRIAPVVGTLLALTASPLLPTPAHAACASPTIEVSPTLVDAGQQVRVTGEGFVASCDGLDSQGNPLPGAKRAQDVTMTFAQGDRTRRIGPVTITADHTFRTRVRVPAWAQPGDAEMRVTGVRPFALTVASDGDPFDPVYEPTETTTSADGSAPDGDAQDSAAGGATNGTGSGGVDDRDPAQPGSAAPSAADGTGSGGTTRDGELSETGPAATTTTALTALVLLVAGAAAVRGAELAGREVRWVVRPDGTRRRRRARR